MAKKIAIILFNLGGPDKPESVKPFLFNLFNDPAIIGAPKPIRWMIAKLISSRREKTAQEIYDYLGGGSPILPLTQDQENALDAALSNGEHDYKSFIAMRYWHPRAAQTAAEVKSWGADEIILLPLYPQFSTTTSGSSIAEWHKVAQKEGLDAPTKTLCCYPTQNDFINAHASLIKPVYSKAKKQGTPRILFSAHGLPKKIIEKGDPYQWQVEKTAAKVVETLGVKKLDHVVCYQSKVGPLEWIGPSTEDEIIQAAKENIPLIIVPIAFVSEHSETLVELDIEYLELAEKNGLDKKRYHRVPALAAHADFIASLAKLCQDATTREVGSCAPHTGQRLCPENFKECPCKISSLITTST